MSKMIALLLTVLTLSRLQAASAELLEASNPELSFSKGLTYGEVRHWHRQAGKTPSLASSTLQFGTFPIKTRSERYIQVHNPTNEPILVQFHLLPDDIESILWQGCNSTNSNTPSFDLDDEECENCQEAVSLHCSSDAEEVRNLSAQLLPPLPPKHFSVLDKVAFQLSQHLRERLSFRLDALPRYKYVGKGEWVLQSQEVNGYMVRKGVQGFFLAGQARNAVLIAPGQSKVIGTVSFEATAIGEYRGKLLIRTNASIFDVIDLTAEAKYARIAFRREISYQHSRPKVRASAPDMSSLDLSILEEDLRDQVDRTTQRLPSSVKVTKYFQAENVGTTELRISKVLINGKFCSLMGLSINNCDQTYILKPNQTLELAISYEFTFVQRELQAFLWVFTEEDGFYLPLKVNIYVEDLGKYAKLRSYEPDSVSYWLSELFTLLDILISVGYLVIVGKDVLIKPEIVHFRLFSAQKCANVEPFCLKIRIQPPVLMRKIVPEPEEPEILPPSQPILSENPPKITSLKPKKCKKIKSSILKFAPNTLNSPNKPETTESHDIIATNRLLLTKKKQKSMGSGEILVGEIESEQPGGPDLQLFESSTTTHSEDGETESEYLDYYKTRQGLFSGFFAANY